MSTTKLFPSVAIVGGGISGLVCANRLQQLGFTKVTVFDTGKNAPGGRCASREISIQGVTHVFDHACQYFTVSDKRFANIVSFLHNKKAIKIWNARIGHLKRGGMFRVDLTLTQAFIGTHGMQTISDCLASTIDLQRPVWVGHVSWEGSTGKWKVDRFGCYDYLVIAHNGKCADKLMSNAGAPEIHSLLRVRFNDTWNPRDRRMHLCSLWVLLVAFEKKLHLDFEAAHVDDADISWISNNTSKYGHESTLNGNGTSKYGNEDAMECWSIISTKAFGKFHKVPQENIPPSTEKLVTEKLLSAFRTVTGRNDLPPVCYTRVQLWGAAVPINVLDSKADCIFDAHRHVGVCGDWLTTPCVQGAALSGMALAERIQKSATGHSGLSAGFEGNFQGTTSSAIGSFPIDKSLLFKPNK